MSPSQRGYYINLLSHAWLSEFPGNIPNDPSIIWKLAGAESRQEFEKESALVLAQFKPARGGKTLANPRLVQCMRVMVLARRERSVAGRAGASSRWRKGLDGSAIGLPLAKHGSASAFASASASASAIQDQDLGGKAAKVPPSRSGNRTNTEQQKGFGLVAKMAEQAGRFLVGNPGLTDGDLREELKTWAASYSLEYHRHFRNGTPHLDQAITIARERLRSEPTVSVPHILKHIKEIAKAKAL